MNFYRFLLTLLFLSGVFFTDAQTVKVVRTDAYFPYIRPDLYIQFQRNHSEKNSDFHLIRKERGKEDDSALLIRSHLNPYSCLVDSFIVRDFKDRKLLEGYYSDSTEGILSFAKTVWSFYSLKGIKSGKFIFYDHESDEPDSKRLMTIVENHKNGLKNGEFIEYYPDGIQKKEIFHYKNDLLEGEYILYHPDGTFDQKGEYKNNLKNGSWVSYHENNQPAHLQQYKDGIKQGQCREWYPDGKIAVQTNYQEGKKNGIYYSYHPNKRIKDSCVYSFDKLQGKSIAYYANGKLQKEGTYKDGRPMGDYKYWAENGQLLQHFPYKYGMLNGTVLKYFPSGQLFEKIVMVNDTLNGDYLTYYENGQIKTKAKYKMGILLAGAQYFDPEGKKIKVHSEPLMDEEEDIPEIMPEPQHDESDQMYEGLTFTETQVNYIGENTKEDLKILKKLKGKSFKVRIDEKRNQVFLFDKKSFSSKFITEATEMLKRHLELKSFTMDGYAPPCTITLILE